MAPFMVACFLLFSVICLTAVKAQNNDIQSPSSSPSSSPTFPVPTLAGPTPGPISMIIPNTASNSSSPITIAPSLSPSVTPTSKNTDKEDDDDDDGNGDNNGYEEETEDGAIKFLRFIFSSIGVIFVLISILIAIRNRIQGRDLREARRRMAERRRRRRQRRNNPGSAPPIPPQPPTEEDEQARYEKIVSTFYFQTVLKDKSNITADSFMEEGDQEDEVEEEKDAFVLAEFFPWRKTASKDECCICLECYVPGESICVAISEECDHVFHEECIVEWLKTHNECPLCRVKLLSAEVSDNE
ncbi:unnamed protein product [Cylindrotheca closterium]|uniref:RING-type domain-containing protein n=1 Tax=Cylindrotheca closterium TaxID=2856 RepID=A0AAD2FZL4_9STRA|nr:unnamed protein product [Cylindrotheca closterium]